MSLLNNRMTHAYIVCGASAQSPFVRALLSEILCAPEGGGRPCGICSHCNKAARGIHPDVTVISKPEGKKEIHVDQIREVVFSAGLLPNESEYRVIVVDCADKMNANAQNALLKLLEEPPKHIALLLLSDEPGALLPTVRSRCRVIEASSESEDIPEDIKSLAARYFELAMQGGERLVEFSFELDKTDKHDFALFLSEVRNIAAKHFRFAIERNLDVFADARAIIDVIKKAEEYLIRNVSTMHISALLCTFSDLLD